MAGFMYFVPGTVGQLTIEHLRERGLAHAFDETPFCREARGDTPSGTPGLVVGDRRRMGDYAVKLSLDEQTWRKLPGLDAYVGWYTEAPPTPADLVRPRTLSSFDLTMADGNEWKIPLVRVCDDEGECQSMLPTKYDLNDAGQLVRGQIVAEYAALWDLTQPFWEAMITESDVNDQDCLECAGTVIGHNYYIGWQEAAIVGLFSDCVGPAGLVAVAVGYFTWQRWQDSKKKTPSDRCLTEQDSDTTDGAAA